MAFELQDELDARHLWLQEARADARAQNPLVGYCERIYFMRTSCRRRSGPKKGMVRKYSSHEVELLKFLPSGRCVAVRDLDTPGLDRLAEEIFHVHLIPPHLTPARLFLDYFRQL